MSKAIVIILALVAVGLGVSISQGWINFKAKTNPTTTASSSADVNVNVDKSKFKSDMEAIRNKYNDWTKDTDTRMKELQIRADKADGDAKVKIQTEIDRLKKKKEEIARNMEDSKDMENSKETTSEKLSEFRKKSEAAWGEFTEGLKKSYDSFK